MLIEFYEEQVEKTRQYPDAFKIIYPALKLNGEAGEVAEKIGKLIRDKGWDGKSTLSQEDRKRIVEELGDICWYIVALAHDLGVAFDTVLFLNNIKLESRIRRNKIKGEGDER